MNQLACNTAQAQLGWHVWILLIIIIVLVVGGGLGVVRVWDIYHKRRHPRQTTAVVANTFAEACIRKISYASDCAYLTGLLEHVRKLLRVIDLDALSQEEARILCRILGKTKTAIDAAEQAVEPRRKKPVTLAL